MAAVYARPAAAGVIVTVPRDPTCPPPPGISEVQVFDGQDYIVIDGGVANLSEFVNCTGGVIGAFSTDPSVEGLNGLYLVIDDVPPTPPNPATTVTLEGNGLDTLTPALGLSNALIEDLINTDAVSGSLLEYEAFCSSANCPGMTEGDAAIVEVPEPSGAELLLFGIGLTFLGFGGWKRSKMNSSASLVS